MRRLALLKSARRAGVGDILFGDQRVVATTRVCRPPRAPAGGRKMALPLHAPVVCPVLLGRDAHLDALRWILDRCTTGSGTTLLISGEAGLGKTRLAAEARRGAAECGFLVLQGNCFEPDRSLAYGPLLDLLRGFLAAGSDEDLRQALGTAAPEVIKLLPELSVRLPDIQPTPAL